MKFFYRLAVFSLLVTIQFSCTKKAVVRFSQKAPELTSADILTEIMLVNKSPRIVLRVPNTRTGITNTQANSNSPIDRVASQKKQAKRIGFDEPSDAFQYDEVSLYNAIEKQLFREGFSVRDRALFNEVLEANQRPDYSKISSLTNTDLILELVRLDDAIGYTTNVCYTQPDDQQRIINEYRDMRGASVEFKLIHVKSNEIVGSYKLHYTPCLNGCPGLYKKVGSSGLFLNPALLKLKEEARRKQKTKPYETLDQDELEAFIVDATHQLVKTMR
ncbi:hypothetical protein [Spirosoma rhododendri]|uniref:Uncharacterized protein n=1 Tax=Spirosoma rhododendri TaxID=2728024 RepID=A0A7L5DNW1_9BACT|nr:hypothetical protein [Spirosoma rhododendri]QJD78883.1 hypothetical protein HH216_10905 [Spirosoma rhododendri]